MGALAFSLPYVGAPLSGAITVADDLEPRYPAEAMPESRSAVLPFLCCLLLLLGVSGLFFGAFRFAAFHGAVMRMRLFVVLAAWAAEEEENWLSVLAHKSPL